MQVVTASLADGDHLFEWSGGCYLVRMNDRQNVLVDTGMPPDVNLLDGALAIEERKNVVEQLADLGIKPEEISVVISTHFDADHVGHHEAFSTAEFVVQRKHYELARGGHPRFAAGRAHWDHPKLRYRLIDGDIELMPGLSLIETSGHATGHQSVLVDLPRTGAVLLTIDAVSLESLFVPDRASGPNDENEDELRTSTRKLIDLVGRENVRLVVFHHDGRQWQKLKKAPEYYA
jgi:N-acyl homoserine lactone hydrolase